MKNVMIAKDRVPWGHRGGGREIQAGAGKTHEVFMEEVPSELRQKDEAKLADEAEGNRVSGRVISVCRGLLLTE